MRSSSDYAGEWLEGRDAMKWCKKCGEWKQLVEFKKDNRRSDGVGSHCKACANKLKREWRAKSPKARLGDRRSYLYNREKILERNRKWAKDNPDKVREIARNSTRRWRVTNREKEIERNRKHRELNREEVSRKLRERRRANPDKAREYKHNRRARRSGNGGRITSNELKRLKELCNYTCLCCGRSEPEVKLTLDHVKPLVLGGTNTIDNAQMLCGICNSRKGAKHIDYREGWIWQGCISDNPDGLLCEAR